MARARGPRADQVDHCAIHVPAVVVPERVHDDAHLLLWQVVGSTTLVLDGTPVELVAGQALWIPVNVRHALVVAPDSVLFPANFATSTTATTLRRVAVVTVDPEMRLLLLTLTQIQSSILRPDFNIERQVLARMEDAPPLPDGLAVPTNSAARTVALSLRFNPGDSRTVPELAASVAVSERTLERAFRSDTGLTLREWRLRNRMAAAAMLFRETDNIAAVAFRVGYRSTNAFHRVFRGHFGCTPGEFIARLTADS